MNKVLRSLIHERFPFDLRVKMELISKRRDCTNGEKQDEIVNLLRTNGLDITELGSGTNRYAFKLDGFVVKVATDNDGKIDNLKEFKMAKRLYPYVTKVYEVSDNGTLLVAEYIQPFTSFMEMCSYQDKIRKILAELSSVYLIGDVGISSNNFTNWGLRIGTDDPVCLDFAYVYNVRSELFICTSCKTNSMLIPDNDFKELYCSNPSCGKRVKFEEIRSRIGNDLHRHEIGDLSKEGYKLTKSNVFTELTVEQSNYLSRKKNKKFSKTEQKNNGGNTYDYPIIEEDVDNKEEINMANKDYLSIAEEYANSIVNDSYEDDDEDEDYVVINAVASPVNKGPRRRPSQQQTPHIEKPVEEEKVEDIMVESQPVQEEVVEESITTVIVEDKEDEEYIADNGLAFEGPIDEDEQDEGYFEMKASSDDEDIDDEEDDDEDEEFNEKEKAALKALLNESKASQEQEVVESTVKGVENYLDKVYADGKYIENIKTSISKISNTICKFSLIKANMFDEIKNHLLQKKTLPESFYKSVQDCIYKSLMEFCGFIEEDRIDANGKKFKFYSAASGNLDEEEFNDTLTFIERWWSYREINSSDNPMKKYREMFKDYDGIQYEWIEKLEEMIKRKVSISDRGINKIINGIKSTWCSTESLPHVNYNAVEIETGTSFYDDTVNDSDDKDSNDEYDSGDQEEYLGDDDEEEYLSVRIYHADDTDVITIGYPMECRMVEIPFYTKLGDIQVGKDPFKLNHDVRNGIWDWVVHTRPAIIFKTKHPDEWLDYLNKGDLEEGSAVGAIISSNDEVTFIGIYFLSGIYALIPNEDESDIDEVLALDKDIITKINIVVNENLNGGKISSFGRSLASLDKAYDELVIAKTMLDLTDEDSIKLMDAISKEVSIHDEEQDQSQNVIDDEDEEFNEKEKAALKALLNEDDSEHEEVVVIETKEPPVIMETPAYTENKVPYSSSYGEMKQEDVIGDGEKVQTTFKPFRRKN